jgi:hypothetical protein
MLLTNSTTSGDLSLGQTPSVDEMKACNLTANYSQVLWYTYTALSDSCLLAELDSQVYPAIIVMKGFNCATFKCVQRTENANTKTAWKAITNEVYTIAVASNYASSISTDFSLTISVSCIAPRTN